MSMSVHLLFERSRSFITTLVSMVAAQEKDFQGYHGGRAYVTEVPIETLWSELEHYLRSNSQGS